MVLLLNLFSELMEVLENGIQDVEDKDIILGGLLRVDTGDGSRKCG